MAKPEGQTVKSGHQSDVLHVDAAADRVSGEIVQAGGLAGIVLGLNEDALKNGERIAVDTGAQILVESVEGATTFTEGADVGWDDTNNQAVASGATASDFTIGKAIEATSAGGDPVKVKLNG